MANVILPRPQSFVLDGNGRPTREWYDFFRLLLESSGEQIDIQAEIDALAASVAALENREVDFGLITGDMSVQVSGVLGESVLVRLQNDEPAPGAYRYYGTGSTGTKGYFPAVPVSFESVSKNISSWDATYAYALGVLDTITYTDGAETIVKTFGYTLGVLTSITLSGDTPGGIDLVKTLTYTGADLTSVDYT